MPVRPESDTVKVRELMSRNGRISACCTSRRLGNVEMRPGLCSITSRFVPGNGSMNIGWSKVAFVKAISTFHDADADGAVGGKTLLRYGPIGCGWSRPKGCADAKSVATNQPRIPAIIASCF